MVARQGGETPRGAATIQPAERDTGGIREEEQRKGSGRPVSESISIIAAAAAALLLCCCSDSFPHTTCSLSAGFNNFLIQPSTLLFHAAHPPATLHCRLARFVSVDFHHLLLRTILPLDESLLARILASASIPHIGNRTRSRQLRLTSFAAGALLNGMFFEAFLMDTWLVPDTRDVVTALGPRDSALSVAVGSAQFPEPKPGAKVTFAPSGV
ncbi:hypothetical protein BO83DRAFT_325380 [Aspergillus eucalypticola CBS 122712]|uniref:Uncharacterized protein n=1 Tax=Aspergillus eucalypticola (strain CBS 122712 / IBT 29274) TaxID=1448314 RepID=A0A317UMD9_ASPEC|nr:uncharacterized protein BO83DRAFT_325380 [Aspergillus eucalypticola CBS 122712]PWY62881.1 hypothetical protein BO83DRAFT_325380 [Aspergillus eucalypticola CBS 122712]